MSARGRRLRRGALLAVAAVLSLLVVVPFLLVVVNSLKDRVEAQRMLLTPPIPARWANYPEVIARGRLVRSFFNSTLISVASVLLSVLAAALASFVISRRDGRMERALYLLFLLGLVAPVNMITVIRALQAAALMGTYAGIILLYASLLLPLSIFLYAGFIRSVPRQLDEAAVLDGAGPWRLFFTVVLPMLAPVTITVALINFMNAWNDFLIPLYVLNRSDKWPMTIAVYDFFGTVQRRSEWNLVFADVILTAAPVVVVYLFGQKYLVSGMTAGALKA
jgi:raffinose/stachyose/melibiose transport system permease protein